LDVHLKEDSLVRQANQLEPKKERREPTVFLRCDRATERESVTQRQETVIPQLVSFLKFTTEGNVTLKAVAQGALVEIYFQPKMEKFKADYSKSKLVGFYPFAFFIAN